MNPSQDSSPRPSQQNNYGGTNYQIQGGPNSTFVFNPEPSQSASENRFNMPYPRNPFFTGRGELLRQLHQKLTAEGTAAINQVQAISGLGGIGKTQTAVEYAYRYFHDQSAYEWVFWLRADTALNLQTDFAGIAPAVGLPVVQEIGQQIESVRRWLGTHEKWLLVFDNADKPEVIKPYLPTNPKGRVLITSRREVLDEVGVANPVTLGTWEREESVNFLFERVGSARTELEVTAAKELAAALGDLPLALEQAGAFVRRRKLGFGVYLNQYYKQSLALLEKTGPVAGNYEKSVLTTWQINFDAVAEANQASVALLRLSAFLAPDEIPYELFWAGRQHLGEELAAALEAEEAEDFLFALSAVLEPLSEYSLIQLEPENSSYSIHRMVQEVLREQMDSDGMSSAVEQAVAVSNAAFPSVEFKNWGQCSRILPHGVATVALAETQSYQSEVLGRLLNQLGSFLYYQGRYAEAEPLYQQALALSQELLGEAHPDVATSLNNLALLYYSQGRYAEAEPLYQQALALRQELLGEAHPQVATSLNNLAGLYDSQGRYAEAEPLYQQALALRQELLGEAHPDVATSLNNLAALYESQGRYAEAEPLYQQALALMQKLLGEAHPDVATSLNNLALLYKSQGRYAEAEPLYQQALALRQELLGEAHPNVAISYGNLAGIYEATGRYEQAEPLRRKALQIHKEKLGEDHPYIATGLNNLAELYRSQGRYAEAEPLFQQALALRQELLGEAHPDVATSLNNLAGLYESQGRYAEAEPLYQQALALMQELLGEAHPDVATSLNNLAVLRYHQGHLQESEALLVEVLEMRDRLLGSQHPYTASTRRSLENLRQAMVQ